MTADQDARDANVAWAVALANSSLPPAWSQQEAQYFLEGCIALVKTTTASDIGLPLTESRIDRLREYPTVARRLLAIVRHAVRRLLADLIEAQDVWLFNAHVRCSGLWTVQFIDGKPVIGFILSCKTLPRQFLAEISLLVAHTIASPPFVQLQRCDSCRQILVLTLEGQAVLSQHDCRGQRSCGQP